MALDRWEQKQLMAKIDRIVLFDQNTLDTWNSYLSGTHFSWTQDVVETPLEIGRGDKPFCAFENDVRHNASKVLAYTSLGHATLDPNFINFFNQLEKIDYNGYIWSSDEGMPLSLQLSLSPLGQFKFVLEGVSETGGKFMTVATKRGMPSNLTPAIIPAPLHVVSMFFMNEIDGSNEDINFYLDDSLVYTWNLRNARYGTFNALDSVTPIMSLPERSLLSAEIVNKGDPKARDGYIEMIFRLVGDPTPGEFINPTL